MSRRMRTLTMLLALAGALGLAGIRPAAAEVTTNVRIPINTMRFVPCANGGAGEFVALSGELHILISTTTNENNVSGKALFRWRLSGTGLVTGDPYVATGESQDHSAASLQHNSFTLTFVSNFRIIGRGPGNNAVMHEIVHTTINANGDVTADVEHDSVWCM